MRLRALVAKEVRELLRERLVLFGLIIMPALIMVFIGGLQAVAIKGAVEETVKPITIAVCTAPNPSEADLQLARQLADRLNATLESPGCDPERLLGEGYKAVIVVERGAGDLLREGRSIPLQVYVSIEKPSFMSTAVQARVSTLVDRAVRGMVAEMVREALPGATPEFLASPVNASVSLMIWGRLIPAERFMSFMMGIVLLPMVMLILLSSSLQVGAISIGLERESKTLEMLLTSPITPGEIVASKILGVLAVTLMGAASFGLGMLVYTASLKASIPAEVQDVGLSVSMTPGVVATMIAGLAMSLYIAGVLGLILGLGAEDVRGAQMVASYLGFLLLVPYIAVFIGVLPDVQGATGKLLLLDPLYPPMLAVIGAQFGRHGLLALSLAAQAGHVVLWTLVAKKLLQPERLVAGIPLARYLRARLGRRRGLD